MIQDPLLTALLELDAALNPPVELIVGGGYGLFLKQLYLKENRDIQTFFPFDNLPAARTILFPAGLKESWEASPSY